MTVLQSCLLLLGSSSMALAAARHYPRDAVPANATDKALTTEKKCDYEVKWGEYCYKIAQDHDTDVNGLLALNPDLNNNCDLIKEGQHLNVPCKTVEKIALDLSGECTKYHTVVSGDSCWKITQDYPVGPAYLKGWNNLDDKCSIDVGQKLCVSHSNIKCNKYHTIVPNDNCIEIAKANNIELDDLRKVNTDLLVPGECFIDVGQKICVDAEKAAAPETSTAAATTPATTSAVVATKKATKFVTSFVTRPSYNATSTAQPVSQATEAAVADSADSTEYLLSVQIYARVKIYALLGVGNFTTPPPDKEYMPSKPEIQKIVKEVAKQQEAVAAPAPAPAPASSGVKAPAPASAVPAALQNQPSCNFLFKMLIKIGIKLTSAGCTTGKCAVVATTTNDVSPAPRPAFVPEWAEPKSGSSPIAGRPHSGLPDVDGRISADARVSVQAESGSSAHAKAAAHANADSHAGAAAHADAAAHSGADGKAAANAYADAYAAAETEDEDAPYCEE